MSACLECVASLKAERWWRAQVTAELNELRGGYRVAVRKAEQRDELVAVLGELLRAQQTCDRCAAEPATSAAVRKARALLARWEKP